MSEYKKCPHCGDEIDHLCFSVSVEEYGTCSLDRDDFDPNSSDVIGDYNYTCPNCGHDLYPSELEDMDEDEEEKKEDLSPKDKLNKDYAKK